MISMSVFACLIFFSFGLAHHALKWAVPIALKTAAVAVCVIMAAALLFSAANHGAAKPGDSHAVTETADGTVAVSLN
ncbi:MAG: hypothetical protein LBU26_06985 [Synergistaceae bacterium]|jgi:hypothetical protein|nr:hypothetical protein [Synergistaceae bacterium]